MATTSEKRRRFHELHAAGCFVVPNPWDVGSARLLENLGFEALASTSSGFAWSQGRRDHHVPLETILAHFEALASSVTTPVTADFEGGHAVAPKEVTANLERAAETGLAGLSIEDSSRDPDKPLYDFDLAVERVRAARETLGNGDDSVLLTARSEGFLLGRPDLDETVRRLQAFSEAGADCLFAPGLQKAEEIEAVVQAVAPKPVNVLVGGDFTTLEALAAIGVRRISVGGALAGTAWAAFLAAAREIADEGAFSGLARAAARGEMEQAFSR